MLNYKQQIEKHNIQIIYLWFVDILGYLKSVSITPRQLDRAIKFGANVDGSSIEGFARIEESDLIAKPDINTFKILPTSLTNTPSACFICDLQTPSGEVYSGCSRNFLKHTLKQKLGGKSFYVGPEIEFFYLKDNKTIKLLDNDGYFDLSMTTNSVNAIRETVNVLEQMDIKCECLHSEVAPSQFEIDLQYDHALSIADNIIITKFIIKQIAIQHNIYATFMPKIMADENGSGMHLHQSIFDGNKNLFYNKDIDNLSDYARFYIAGILEHISEITAILNQSVNSYKRLVPKYEAPTYISWGQKNRSVLVRVPHTASPTSKRIELRNPDPICNPYLTFAMILSAGLKGVKEKYPLAEPIEYDMFSKTDKKIKTLPKDLYGAIRKMEKSEFVKQTLWLHIFGSFIKNKKIQWEKYCAAVTDYEIDSFLSKY